MTNEHVSFTGPEHVLIIGPTRSGKSRRLIAPNLLLDTTRSALVIDLKGELYHWTARHRHQAGHRIVAIDPFGIAARSSGFNPLSQLDPNSPDFVDDATGVAEAAIQVPQHEPHWAEGGLDLLAGLMMAESCKHGASASLRRVRQLLTAPVEELARAAAEAVTNVTVQLDGWHPAIANKLNVYAELTAEHRELLSIISAAKVQTRFLDSGPVMDDLEKPGFDFAVLKRELATVYLILPPQRLRTHAKWLRLMIDAAIRDMQRQLQQPGQREVLFVLDEFPQLGTMRSIEISMALNAGYGVKVLAAIQHIGQLKQLYAENWETFLSGGLVTSFAPRDVETSEHLSRLSGQEWVDVTSTTANDQGAGSVSISKQLQPVVLPHQFRQMPKGDDRLHADRRPGPGDAPCDRQRCRRPSSPAGRVAGAILSHNRRRRRDGDV